ncbi:MAG: ComF family protein [Synechococcaceae cyanobacterium]|nr:ComF family protein [Synechococcaceae cyanobacterium]
MTALGRLVLGALLVPSCPLCRRPRERPEPGRALCATCRSRLGLPSGPLEGTQPLPWWAVGHYRGGLRSLLLTLKQRPERATLAALLAELRTPPALAGARALLVPIPSWKRSGNTLPALIGQGLKRRLGARQADLLEHRHPLLGQHHLNRRLRFANLEGAFRCRRRPAPGQARRSPVLIIDDILTTGATACSAAAALEESGWHVAGVICLARTPAGGGGDRW